MDGDFDAIVDDLGGELRVVNHRGGDWGVDGGTVGNGLGRVDGGPSLHQDVLLDVGVGEDVGPEGSGLATYCQQKGECNLKMKQIGY